MIKLEQILVPTDFSEFSSTALKYGCELASRFGARLHLLHVVEDNFAFVPDGGLVVGAELIVETKQAAEKAIERLPDADWLPNGRDQVQRSVVQGTPFVEVVRYAKSNEIDLIVVGSHGRTGLSHMLLGSVAELVVRKAPCPVLTVRPGQHEFVMP